MPLQVREETGDVLAQPLLPHILGVIPGFLEPHTANSPQSLTPELDPRTTGS